MDGKNNSNIKRLRGKLIVSVTLAFKNEFEFPLPGLQIRIKCKQPQHTCTLMTYVYRN